MGKTVLDLGKTRVALGKNFVRLGEDRKTSCLLGQDNHWGSPTVRKGRRLLGNYEKLSRTSQLSRGAVQGLFIYHFFTRSQAPVLLQHQSGTSPTQHRNSNSTRTNRIPLSECTIEHTRVLVATVMQLETQQSDATHKQAIARYVEQSGPRDSYFNNKAKRTKEGRCFRPSRSDRGAVHKVPSCDAVRYLRP